MKQTSGAKKIYRKYEPFSPIWRRIAQTRCVLCLTVITFTLVKPESDKYWINLYSILYALLLLLAGFLDVKFLRLKRVRLIPAFVDVIFISLIVYYTRGVNSSWFLFYLFPIISVSRYLGSLGSIAIATEAMLAYILVCLLAVPNQGLDPVALALRCISFYGIALMVGNLSGAKRLEETRLVNIFREINNAMLSGMGTDKVFNLTLKRGLELTASEMGHIRLLDDKTREAKLIAFRGRPDDSEWATKPLDESFSQKVIDSNESIIISDITKAHLRKYLGTYFSLYKPRPRSALFVPIAPEGSPIGVIAVYSRRRLHYTKREQVSLERLTPLIALAMYADQKAKLMEKYHEAETYYKNLFLNSPDPIIVLDEQGKIKDFNKACEQVWDFSSKEVLGEPVEKYYESAQHARAIKKALWLAAADDYSIKNFEAKIKDRHGKIIPISLSASLLLNDKNELLGSIGVFKDLELNLLKERMLESERLTDLGEIAHSLGHDIKTEMGIILSYINQLLSGCDKEKAPDVFDAYTEIRDAALYSTEKLQNMLLASTPTPPTKKAACLEDIFVGIRERMERQASSKGITFSIAYPEADYDIYLDVEQLKQVFWNLYNNSSFSVVQRKRSDPNFEGGRIEVSASVDGNYLILFWRDDGMGIPDDDIPNIFNAFFTKKASGSGLGLYISKSIIDAHGGQISVEPQSGGGACFRIALPILKHADEME